jgi:hypothetical protein
MINEFLADKWSTILFSSFGLGLLLTAVTAVINHPVLHLLLAVVFISLALFFFFLKKYLFLRKITKDGATYELDPSKKAIIFTIGFRSAEENSILFKVFEKVRPEFVGFLETKETNNKGIVASIVQKLQLPEDNYKTMVVDPTNINEIKTSTNLIVNWLCTFKLNIKDILLDLTASTALMSVASFMASDELQMDTLYIYSKYLNNLPVDGTQKTISVRCFEP